MLCFSEKLIFSIALEQGLLSSRDAKLFIEINQIKNVIFKNRFLALESYI